jgi:ubiquinone/menaquinone biosynthesis C-methylase UbiE
MAGMRRPIFARCYAWLSRSAEPLTGVHRDRLVAGLTGRVLEVGAGNGLNFSHYPATVTVVLAVEPNPYLRGLAEQAAASALVPVRVVEGVAEQLPAADGEFDAAVASLVLCSVPDQQRALAELRRVLRPGGELRFFEHVIAHDSPRLARTQRRLDRVWGLFAGGCHINRDTLTAITTAGFTVADVDRFRFPENAPTSPAAPHILGSAHRP